MFISRKQKPFLRVLSILIIIAIIGMSFPGMLMASEINGFPQATENSTVSQASQPLNTNPIDLSENNNVTSLPQPDKDKLPSSKDNDIGNGIHIIHESNMPNFNETPKPFIPDPKLLGSNNTVPASNASENNYQSNNDNMLYYTNNAQFDFIDTGTPSGNGNQPPSTTGNNATEPTGTPSDNGSQNPSTIDSNATGTADTPSNNGNQNPSATDLTNSDKTQTGGNDQDLTDNEPASQDSNDYPIKNTGGSYIAGFSRQAGKNLLKFTMANSSLVLSPLKASTVSAQIDKNTISFKDLYPHTDFSYTAQQNFLKEDITINQATTRSALYFQFNLQNAVAQVQPSGEISFADPVTGKVLFYMDKPIALDNNDNPCQNVNMGITKQGFLKLSVDSAWLKDAAYPINIEPTIYLAEDSSSMPDLGNTYPIENKGGLYKVGFNSQSGQNLLQYIQGKASITLDLLNSNPVNGMISDNNIVYRNIYPDVDLRYTANQYQLKETLVVKKATGQSEFNFQLGVNNASYKVSDNGIINFYEQGNTAPSFYMSKPFAVDANGNRCDSVALALTGEGALKLSVDSDWLKKAAYPVTIDPTINLTGSEGTGNKPFWNYTNSNLGGGWNFSVNTFNLNLLLSKALFQIPGRGIPIGESITYNSQDNTSAELGTGWHLGSDISLTVNSDESVIYVAGDGGVYLFTPNGSGGYNAPAGIYLTLAKNPTTGLYTLTDKKLNVTTFLSNGKPDTIVDRNGNTTKYNYDADGRLSTLQDPSGRTITYAYNDSDQLSSIKDPTNNVYNFAYQNNLLISITDPAHNNFTFIYDANNHLNSFTDPLNKVTTFSVNSNGCLQYYRDARTTGQDIYQTTYAQTTVGNQLVTTVTDPGSHTYTYYCDSNTGNLQKYVDGVGDTWQYTWTNNNLMSVQDAKGTTSYTYDNNGNALTKTTTVDSNSADNITDTMTYDNYNQLIKVVDGSGRVTNYRYDVKGNLLSTNNPNNKESNGKIYDQYGNVVQATPKVSANQNLLENGSFERGGWYGNLIVDYWTHVQGGANVNLVQGLNNTHGNQALTMSSGGPVKDYFYQNVSVKYGDYLTLRADITQTMPNDSTPGATIRIDYNDGDYDSWTCYGSGSFPIVVTSRAANQLNFAVASVGFYNGSGQVWFDGVQLEDMGNTNDNYGLSAFNSVDNGGFEYGPYGLTSWNTPSGSYVTVTSSTSYQGTNSAEFTLNTSGYNSIYQDVPVHSGEPLTLIGMVRTNGVTGTGAYYKIDYYNSTGQYLSTVQTGYLTGTQDFAELTCLATAPPGAYNARLSAVLNGSGTAYYDNVKLVPRITQVNTYDNSGNYLTTAEDPLGNQTKQTYDQNTGNVLSSSDALNNTTNYSYDNLNRLTQVTDPLSNNAYYGYDGDSNLTSSRDPRSSSAADNTYNTNFTPNNMNQLGTLTDPLSKNTDNYYDPSGNLETVNLPNGLSLNYQYDNANRMTKKTLDNGKYFNYTYDGANNLIGVTDQNNSSDSLNYDGANRITSSTDSLGNTMSYQYDKSNNITSETVNNKGRTSYTFGSSNQMIGINLPGGYCSNYSYDENSRLFQIQYFGGVKHNIIYLPNGWSQYIEDNAFPGNVPYSYSYNANGTISSIKSWAGTDNYTYDNLSRLTGWSFIPTSGNPVQETYAYDQAGNLTTKGSRIYSYNAANQINGFVYDANGNLTNDGVYTYQYDAENRLTSITGNGLTAIYTYYYNGLRKSKTANGVTTNYNWDAFGRLVKESPSNGNPIYYFYDAKGNPFGFGNLSYDNDNNAVWQIYYYHTNQRGDIVSITDQYGAIKEQYNYDPWGNIISSSGTLTQPLRYAGYYYDSETGLYYLQNRYYSPTLGRFLTKDGYGNIDYENPQTLNLYAYCNNNPVSNVDPSGTDSYYGFYGEDGSVWTEYTADDGSMTITDGNDNVVGSGVNITISNASSKDNVSNNNVYTICSKNRSERPDSGLSNLTDEEISKRAHDNSLSGEERRRYQKEEKLRGLRNVQKRNNLYRIVTGGVITTIIILTAPETGGASLFLLVLP